MFASLKAFLKKKVPAKYYIAYIYYVRRFNNQLDDEMLYVSRILGKKRRFVDVGSNVGIYSYFFNRSFANVDAFEPVKEISLLIPGSNSSLKVHNVALSSDVGEFKLYIPYLNGQLDIGLASLEKRSSVCQVRSVNALPLDSYCFDDVDLIKIDVEGHEMSVIRGAIETIKRSMPILIVEIEQRHIECSITEVFQTILDLSYSGFFLANGSIVSLDKFSYQRNQQPYLKNVFAKEYVNNFIFIPND